MNPPALRRSILVLALALPALSAGCDRHLANGESANIAKNTPEERFKHILESFRRKIEDQPVGFVVSDGGSRTTMMGMNKVSSALIAPQNPDGHFKAVITVSSQSRYSLRRTKTNGDETEHEQNAKNQATNPLADPKEKQGIGILEPDLAGTSHTDTSQSAPKVSQPEEGIVSRRPNEDVRKFELEDDGGRWVLVTKPDPKTEQSIAFAFSEALAHQ
jgi:hypothetical protein